MLETVRYSILGAGEIPYQASSNPARRAVRDMFRSLSPHLPGSQREKLVQEVFTIMGPKNGRPYIPRPIHDIVVEVLERYGISQA